VPCWDAEKNPTKHHKSFFGKGLHIKAKPLSWQTGCLHAVGTAVRKDPWRIRKEIIGWSTSVFQRNLLHYVLTIKILLASHVRSAMPCSKSKKSLKHLSLLSVTASRFIMTMRVFRQHKSINNSGSILPLNRSSVPDP